MISVKASIMAPSFLEGMARMRMALRSYTYATKTYCIDLKEQTGKAPGRSVYMVPVVKSARAVKQKILWVTQISSMGCRLSTWSCALRMAGWMVCVDRVPCRWRRMWPLSVAVESGMVADNARRETGDSPQFFAALECPQQCRSGGRAESLVNKLCVFHGGGGSFGVGCNFGRGVRGRRVGGSRGGRCSKWDQPQSGAGEFVGAQDHATTVQDGTYNFGEPDIQAGIA